jgi:hypothetical protein
VRVRRGLPKTAPHPRLHLLLLLFLPLLVEASPAHAGPLQERLPPPAGFTPVKVPADSFGAWLRALPLLPAQSPVRSFDGKELNAPHARAVVDLDVGPRDLQQCADTAIRLWAEYQKSRGRADELVFHATSGDPLPFARYKNGERPRAPKNKVLWEKKAKPASADDEKVWRGWLDAVFMWAGSVSLAKDTTAVTAEQIKPGDLYVLPGSPGHVLVVLDVAVHDDGRRALLIGQGFMPAQSFHVLGWLPQAQDGGVVSPVWPGAFAGSTLRRFR